MHFLKPNQSIIPFPSRLIDDGYEEKMVLVELMDRKESATNLRRLLKKKPRMGYQNEASTNMHDLAILDDSLTPKEKSPGSFTILCHINNTCFEKALAELRTSVSVMPYSTFTNLGLGDDKIMFKSDNSTNNIIRRFFALGLREQMELDLEARLTGEALMLNRLLDPVYEDYIKLNDLNEPLELKRNQVEDLGPTTEEGEVIDEPMEDIVKTRNDDNEINNRIDEYPSFFVDNMDAYHDEGMGDVIVGKLFCREICVKARRFNGMITIYNDATIVEGTPTKVVFMRSISRSGKVTGSVTS
nr:hypothetical protein [Tanacetum cinerariifolium]